MGWYYSYYFVMGRNFMFVSFSLYLILCFFTLSSCFSVENENTIHPSEIVDYPVQVPILGDSVRVVVLGNSFSIDATTYLRDLVASAGLDTTRICVYNGVINGGSISDWVELYNSGQNKTFTKMAGSGPDLLWAPVSDVLQRRWDVCVLLQSSAVSYSWDSFEGVLDEMVSIVRANCPVKNLVMAYAMPWSHTIDSHPREFDGNVKCAIRLSRDYGMRVIPVGIAVQNARNTHLDNGLYLTRDKWHLCHGVGRYIAACTWFQVLFGDAFGVSVLNNRALHAITEEEMSAEGNLPVDASNQLLCQKCAYEAVKHPFVVTQVEQ